MKIINTNQKWKIGLLAFIVIFGGAGVYEYDAYRNKPYQPQARVLSPAEQAAQAEFEKNRFGRSALRQKYSLDSIDTMDFGSDILSLPEWQQSQTKLYKDALLATGSYDTLVVPFQKYKNHLDENSRQYMSEALVQSLRHAGEKTPSADIVRNILGMHMDAYTDDDVYRLANALGVKKIYWGFSGFKTDYNRVDNNKFEPSTHLLIRVIKQDKVNSQPWSADSVNIKYSDNTYEQPYVAKDMSPIEAFNQYLPTLDSAFNIADTFKKRLYTEAPKLNLDKSMPEMIRESSGSDPLVRAHYLQFLATLVPMYDNYNRGDYDIKSLIALNEVDPASVDYRLLVARAYLDLYMRPRALAILGVPNTDEEKAFYQLLNGNLDGLKDITAKIERAVPRVIAEIQYLDLDYTYTWITKKNEMLRVSGLYPVWQYEVLRRLGDRDLWLHEHSNMDLKAVLDSYYPIPSYSLSDVMASLQTGSRSEAMATLEMSFQKHVDIIKSEKLKTGIDSDALVSDYEYLQLLESIGQNNLIRSIYFYSQIQGAQDTALAISDTVDRIYKGYPSFMLARMSVQLKLSETKSGNEKQNLINEATHLRNTVMKYYAPNLMNIWDGFDIAGDDLYRWNHDNIRELSHHVTELLKQGDLRPEIKEEIKNRFEGNPKKVKLEIMIAVHDKNWAGIEKIYEVATNKYPDDFQNFLDYEKLKLAQGDPASAIRIASQFKPLFDKDTPVNRVGLSSYAYDLGNVLFWDGLYNESIPFYEVASKLNTGSGSSNIATAKIAMLKSDYETSADTFYDNATHYDSGYSYDAYISYLYILGQAAKADALLNDVVHKIKGLEKWHAALTGRRVERQSSQSNCEWLNTLTRLDSSLMDNGSVFFENYLLSRVDRDITQPPDPIDTCILTGDTKLPGAANKPPINTGMPPQMPRFDAHDFFNNVLLMDKDIALKQYADAKPLIQKLMQNCSPVWNCDFTPYQALVDIKLNNTIEGKSPELWLADNTNMQLMDNFSLSLKKALVAKELGKIDDSIKYLQQALLFSNDYGYLRVLHVDYELLEFCERLYQETNDDRYKKLMVDWARKFQHLEPWNSWAYSFEAKYTGNAADKKRALAIGLFLDKDSERLAGFSSKERADAEQWFSVAQPFKSTPTAVKKSL